MKDIIMETLLDSVKLVPFLLVTFIIIEYIEHKLNNKKMVTKAGKMGPLIGSVVGAFPQCGFSVSATNLYATRIITMGTLISVYLSTSDEMLPILISEGQSLDLIVKMIGLKIIIGMFFGFLIDFILRKKQENIEIKEMCEHDHCHCEKGIFKSALKHTINILIFILLISFVLNIGIEYLGEDKLSKLFLKNNILGPFVSSLVGLIPNCGASVVITELYLNHTISFASAIAGLLTGSGVGLLVLFKTNKNMKQNFTILGLIYIIGAVMGVVIELIGMI